MLMRFSFNHISRYKFPRNNCSTDSASVVCTRHSISLTGAIAQVKIKEQSLKRCKTMIVRQPRYSKEEFAVAGDRIYESQVRPQVETGDRGKIVAIDI
jgi:hypothetical protein